MGDKIKKAGLITGFRKSGRRGQSVSLTQISRHKSYSLTLYKILSPNSYRVK